MLREVLRISPAAYTPARTAALVDVETTGLDPHRDEVIEMALLLFAFSSDGKQVLGIVDEYVGLREPRCRIKKGAFRVHGIGYDMVSGKHLDTKRVEGIFDRAEFVASHNACFDRGFLVKMFSSLAAKPWVCTMNDIQWFKKGFASRSLQYLLREHGIDAPGAHRSQSDVLCLLALLSREGPRGERYLEELLRHRGILHHRRNPRAGLG